MPRNSGYPFQKLGAEARQLLHFLLKRYHETDLVPSISPNEAAELLGTFPDTARAYVKQLRDASLLQPGVQPPVEHELNREEFDALVIKLFGPVVRHYSPEIAEDSEEFLSACTKAFYRYNRHEAGYNKRSYRLSLKAINAFPRSDFVTAPVRSITPRDPLDMGGFESPSPDDLPSLPGLIF